MKKLIAWTEIPALDIERAVSFYNSVFKMSLEITDCGTEKMACFPGGEGAISFAPNFNPSKEGVLVSFNVPDDIEQSVKRAELLEGRLILPKTKIEAEGRAFFALITDSEGNKIGLYGN